MDQYAMGSNVENAGIIILTLNSISKQIFENFIINLKFFFGDFII